MVGSLQGPQEWSNRPAVVHKWRRGVRDKTGLLPLQKVGGECGWSKVPHNESNTPRLAYHAETIFAKRGIPLSHPPAVMSEGRAYLLRRYGGYRRVRTFDLAVSGDRLWGVRRTVLNDCFVPNPVYRVGQQMPISTQRMKCSMR